jgi:hypothetical protein
MTVQIGLSRREENSECPIECGDEKNIGNSEEGGKRRKEQIAL